MKQASVRLCDVKAVLDFLELNDSISAEMGALVDRASEAIEAFCRREFGVVARTEYHDGGSEIVVLVHRPIVAVTTIHDDPDRGFPVDSLVQDSSYVVKKLAGYILRTDGSFFAGLNSVKVLYTTGHPTIPDDVQEACCLLAASWYSELDCPSQEDLGVEAANREEWPPILGSVRGLLEPYTESA